MSSTNQKDFLLSIPIQLCRFTLFSDTLRYSFQQWWYSDIILSENSRLGGLEGCVQSSFSIRAANNYLSLSAPTFIDRKMDSI
jgi:hypothetical protein